MHYCAKSWVTSAGEADAYVWTSRPAAVSDGAAMWLVPADSAGLKVAAPFDWLWLRGNASSPVEGSGVRLPVSSRLGDDGAGLDIALGVVLPVFQASVVMAPTVDALQEFIGRALCGMSLFG